MGKQALWAVLVGHCGRELGRVALPRPAARNVLPLREIASEGLRQGAAALVIIRDAATEACEPCALEKSAIDKARQTLGAIGLRLHDYILWHGERSVSLRLTGKL